MGTTDCSYVRCARLLKMLVYKCIVTGSEITTDADNEESEFLWGNTFKKVAGNYKSVGGDDFELAGANASAEEEADTGSADTEKVIDKVYDAKLEPMEYTKKEYMAYLKTFMKKCVKQMKESGKGDDVAAFKSNIQEAIKAITGEWNEYCCYVNEDFDCEGSTVLCRYEGADGATPHFYYLMAGFKATKY